MKLKNLIKQEIKKLNAEEFYTPELNRFGRAVLTQAFKEMIPKNPYNRPLKSYDECDKNDGYNQAIDQFKKNIKDYLEEK